MEPLGWDEVGILESEPLLDGSNERRDLRVGAEGTEEYQVHSVGARTSAERRLSLAALHERLPRLFISVINRLCLVHAVSTILLPRLYRADVSHRLDLA